MNTSKILVTGANGFIGSHLTEKLVRSGYQVKAFVEYNAFNSWGWLDTLDKTVLKEIEIFAGDIRDPFGVKKAMQDCHKVLHLAALIGIPYSYHSPESYVQTNVSGTLNIVQAARELSIEKVIHTSTSEVYGSAQYVPIDEKHPLSPQSPYSASKIAADQIALSYYYAFNVPLTIIRPFNTYGPRQSARAVIPTIISQVNAGATEILLGSLEPTRDFTYIDDTVNAFLLAMEAPNIIGEVLNLGINHEISVGQLVNVIARLMQKEIKPIADLKRVRPLKSEVERLRSDNTKAKALLNWQATYSGDDGLERGLKLTIDWFTRTEDKKNNKSGIYHI